MSKYYNYDDFEKYHKELKTSVEYIGSQLKKNPSEFLCHLNSFIKNNENDVIPCFDKLVACANLANYCSTSTRSPNEAYNVISKEIIRAPGVFSQLIDSEKIIQKNFTISRKRKRNRWDTPKLVTVQNDDLSIQLCPTSKSVIFGDAYYWNMSDKDDRDFLFNCGLFNGNNRILSKDIIQHLAKTICNMNWNHFIHLQTLVYMSRINKTWQSAMSEHSLWKGLLSATTLRSISSMNDGDPMKNVSPMKICYTLFRLTEMDNDEMCRMFMTHRERFFKLCYLADNLCEISKQNVLVHYYPAKKYEKDRGFKLGRKKITTTREVYATRLHQMVTRFDPHSDGPKKFICFLIYNIINGSL